jgi:membrane protein DedA with SNARE-associated domain
MQQPFAPQYTVPRPTSASPGNGAAITGIICGVIAFLFLPPLFGIAGLVCGGIAMSKRESLAPLALIVSGIGLVVGMILGYLVWS